MLNLAKAMENYQFLETIDLQKNRISGVQGGKAIALIIQRLTLNKGLFKGPAYIDEGYKQLTKKKKRKLRL